MLATSAAVRGLALSLLAWILQAQTVIAFDESASIASQTPLSLPGLGGGRGQVSTTGGVGGSQAMAMETATTTYPNGRAVGNAAVEPPSITIRRIEGPQAVIAWPAAASGFFLEAATSLAPPIKWQDTGLEPVQVGADFVLTIPVSGSQKMFRLSHWFAPTGTRPADLVIFNARIFTSDRRQLHAEALAVKGGRITYVGDGKDVADFVGPDTEVINGYGRFVTPGFVDNHCHPLWIA